MYNLYNSDRITNDFLNHLKSSRLSKNSIRFYKSDISHFISWVLSKIKSLGTAAQNFEDVLPFLKPTVGAEYKDYLLSAGVAVKTINRKLSTLRKFAEFLTAKSLIPFDFTTGVENIAKESSLIADFKKHLEGQKASPNTIKNYLADVHHFLLWLEHKS